MNALGFVIAANIVATIVTICGLRLFDVGSDLAEPIRKYGVFLGIIFAFAAIFSFLLPDTLELLEANYLIWTTIVSMMAFAFLGFVIAIAKRSLLEPKRQKSRKRGRMSGLSVSAVAALDVVSGAIVGAAAGISFTLNFGTGIIVLCALVLLQIATKVLSIRQYQDAQFTRRENIAVLVLSLGISPVVASLVNLWARDRYRHMGVFMALAIGYLAYLCLYHLVIVVKKRQKR